MQGRCGGRKLHRGCPATAAGAGVCEAPPVTSSALRAPESSLVLAIALLAGLRVLVFALAFPFFANVDEYRHVDVVLKYARGSWPTPGPDRYEAETVRLVGELGSPEYQRARGATRPLPPPAWRQSDRERAARVERMRRYLGPRYSLEADQPPVYYATAGAWLALGRAAGLPDLALLYTVRALGAAALAALVLAIWWELRALYPEMAEDA